LGTLGIAHNNPMPATAAANKKNAMSKLEADSKNLPSRAGAELTVALDELLSGNSGFLTCSSTFDPG